MLFHGDVLIFGYLITFVSFLFVSLRSFVSLARSGDATRGVTMGCNRQGTSSIRGGEGCGGGGEQA